MIHVVYFNWWQLRLQILHPWNKLVKYRNMKRWNIAVESFSYPPRYLCTTRKRSLGQGNDFTPVCDSFCSQGGAIKGVPWKGGAMKGVPWKKGFHEEGFPWRGMRGGAVKGGCHEREWGGMPWMGVPWRGVLWRGCGEGVPWKEVLWRGWSKGNPSFWSTSGRYASCWNAFLFLNYYIQNKIK